MDSVSSYLQNQIISASPAELIVMLYEEGIRSLKRAEAAFRKDTPDRFQDISNNLLHAQDVITELSVSLDLEKGGEIAENLQRLYDFMVRHLSDANVKKALEPVVAVRELMAELLETWRQVSSSEAAADGRTPAQQSGSRILAAG